MSYQHLFSPITINKLAIRNRVLSTAHAEVYGIDGLPKDRYIAYYEEKAKGGIGLCICGGSSPVSIDSPANWWSSINLYRDEVVPHLANLASAMHKHGAKIMIQATHMGRRSNYPGFDWPHLVSPSGIREPVHKGVAKTIEQHEIDRIIGDFAQAARRVKAGGLDGLEVSCDHQHLIDQFWSQRTNRRADQYGGSLENRMRFGMQVCRAIREQVGKDFCLGIRMCGDEFHEDGLDHEALKEIAMAMAASGLVDFISVTGSGADTHNTLANCMPPMALPPEPFVHLASGIKGAVGDMVVMHAQSIKDPGQAERILASGAIDMVGMTRAHIADPHLLNKLREGKETQIKQCVGANYCIDRQYLGQDVLCVQNAATSREQSMPHTIAKSSGPQRRVLVVGGGPAGLEAARVAGSRGHQVVLFEQSSELGGQINIAAKAPQRDQMAGIVRWFVMEIERLGVDVRLHTPATAETILAEQPDVVVLATGGSPNLGEFPGWGAAEGLINSSWDILTGRVAPAKNVLMYDHFAQQAGSTCADFLAKQGSLVELVTPETRVADDVGGTTFPIFYRSLCASGVIFTPNYWLDKVYREGQRLIARLRHEYTEELEEREVDQVVVENGTLPNDRLYRELKDGSANQGSIDLPALYAATPQPLLTNGFDGYVLYRVGEAMCPRNIHGAIYDSLRLCKDL